MKLKRILSLMLLSLLLATSFFGNTSVIYATNENQDQKFIIEGFNIEDLDNHPDVKDKIIEDGFGEYIEGGEKSYQELTELYDLSDVISYESDSIEGVPDEEVERIREQYNLPEREVLIKEYDQLIVVKRDAVTNKIDGVIGFNLFVTPAGAIRLTMIQLQTVPWDSVDEVNGFIKKYNSTGKDRWTVSNTRYFDEKKVTFGTIIYWTASQDAVSDYFEYELVVKDQNISWKYQGGGKKQQFQRYNFETDQYKYVAALGGHAHHFVSATPLRNVGFKTDDAPAIRMMVADHYKTPSYGGGGDRHRAQEEKYLREKRYTELIQFNVDELKKVPDPEGYYSSLLNKYYNYVIKAIYLSEPYLDAGPKT